MTKRILILLFVAGCFGEGAVPTAPTGVTIVYFVSRPTQNECGNSLYIADVAIGRGHGYAMTLPYTPFNSNCGDNGGGTTPQIDVPVVSFGTTTLGAEEVAIAGRSVNGGPGQARLAAIDDAAAWAYINNTPNGGMLKVSGVSGLDLSITSQMGYYNPAAMTADATTFFVAGTQSGGGSGGSNRDVNDPGYPCCGPLPAPSSVTSQIYAVSRAGTSTTLPLAPKFNCQTLKTCMVNNSTSLVYTEYDQPLTTSSATSISTALKNGLSPTKLGTVARPMGVVVGLGATDTMVVWSSSVAYEYTPYPSPFCHIRGRDLTTNTDVTIFDSTTFACMDAAVDATHVYFAIVDVPDLDGQRMRGLGLGRVTLDGKTFESINVGVEGEAAGPRRVYLEGDDVYAVDPSVIAKLPKSTFAGIHDF